MYNFSDKKSLLTCDHNYVMKNEQTVVAGYTYTYKRYDLVCSKCGNTLKNMNNKVKYDGR